MGMYPGGNIIRVTPTLSEDAYAQGDVLWNWTEIPNVVASRGGTSVLQAMFVSDFKDVGSSDVNILFAEKNDVELGTINATAGISSANFKSNNIIGGTFLDADQGGTGDRVDNIRFNQVLSMSGSAEQNSPLMLLVPATGSTSVYFSGVLHSATTPTYDADSLEFVFHVRYLS